MNEIENKQIEEMARDIEKYVVRDWSKELYIGSAEALYNAGYRQVKDKVVLDNEEWEVLHNDYAKSLYNARQDERKKMQEENGQLRLENNDLEAENNKLKEELRKASELKAETIRLAKQETAREILQTIKQAKENGQIYYNESFMTTAQKAYGVEVE
jgi:hypothetical protein